MNLSRFVSSLYAGILVLAGFWLLLVGSTWNKSITYDELVHAPAGYSYWKHNDYRINPENGNLPQRIAGLGFLGDKFPLPPTTFPMWQLPEEWEFGEEWFHGMGYDVPSMLHHGRAVAALQAVALAALVWLWSRRLFGPIPGLVSLGLCTLNPTILANGGLITSDTAAALFFLASTWALWGLLHRVSPGRIALAVLTVGGLFVSKSSALLILPIGLVLLVARLIEGSPLQLAIGNWRSPIAGWRRQLAVFAILTGLLVATTFTTIWGFYGFRYAAFAPGNPSKEGSVPLWRGILGEQSLPEIAGRASLSAASSEQARRLFDRLHVPTYGWDSSSAEALEQLKSGILTPEEARGLDQAVKAAALPVTARFIQFLARHHLLPEGFLFGTAHAWRFAQYRSAFFNGEFSSFGSAWFFPYTFFVKTPLPLLALIVVAIGAAFLGRRQPGGLTWKSAFYRTLPLWTLFGLYWLAAVNSRLNIGHRHILTTYPPLFILCGVAGVFLVRQSGSPAVRQSGSPIPPPDGPTARPPNHKWRIATLVLLGLCAIETGLRFPNYISYFNGIVAPDDGYRHFVDSTVDWGQDLPGVRKYIDEHPSGAPFSLSYFGNGDPRSYGIKANFLPSKPGRFRRDLEPLVLLPVGAGGTAPAADELQRKFPTQDFLGISQGAERYAVLVRKPEAWALSPGTFLISATDLQVGWTDDTEQAYHSFKAMAAPFEKPVPNGSALFQQHNLAEWRSILSAYDSIRYGRLAAFLKAHIPNDEIGHSILVFKVTAADLDRALNGPPPPSGYLNRKLNP